MIFYPILFFSFSVIDWLTAGKSKAWCHHRLFGGKTLRVYCWEKNQPPKFDKTDYQTLPITYFSLYLALLFHGYTKRLCPNPIVGLRARLRKLTTITNGTAAGKFDIVFGRDEKHSCCWHLIIALLWMKESDSLFVIILSTKHRSRHRKVGR